MELLIGCGHRREKILYTNNKKEWVDLVTLDHNDATGCDVVHDLEQFPYPFSDNAFQEIHAYEVLEHTGVQGDHKFFFKQFEEFHRILEPNGLFFASVPCWDAMWAWGDPSHKRVLNEGSLSFLSQTSYEECSTTARTDFRYCYKGDFEVITLQRTSDMLFFALKALK